MNNTEYTLPSGSGNITAYKTWLFFDEFISYALDDLASYIISKNFMQWSLEAMEKDLQQQYLDTESNSRLFFDTFFELCRKFNIQYSIATSQEKAFIDEVTESIYERKKAERDGKAPTYQQRV